MQTAATLNYSPDPTLTPVQHRAINMLAEGQTISAIAAALNLHRNTIGNWRRSVPAFARELEFAAREQSLYWHEQAAALAPKAIEVQCTILHNEDASPSLRLRAALAVVKMAADPHPKSLRPFLTATAEMEAAHGQLLAWERPAPAAGNAPRAHPHNPAQSSRSAVVWNPAATLPAHAVPASNSSAAAPTSVLCQSRKVGQAPSPARDPWSRSCSVGQRR